MVQIPTYIINLKERVDRRIHILNEFSGRQLYRPVIVDAIRYENGAFGLWETIKFIINKLADPDLDYILICEDDHEFTADYSDAMFLKCISDAKDKGADVLCGGVSWFENAIQASENLFWIDSFSGTQFIVVYKSFWKVILDASFDGNDTADFKIGNLSNNIFFSYPFLSRQRDYGYSDATPKNNVIDVVNNLFDTSIASVDIIKEVIRYYKKRVGSVPAVYNLDIITIPTYIINLPERRDRREHMISEFAGRREFDVTFVDAVKHKIGALGHWLSIRRIVADAIEKDEDVIIICEDDHVFTEDYTREYLLLNIIEAGMQGCSYLSGGTSKFRTAIPVSSNRYWVSCCLGTQFTILYRNIFSKIMDEPFDLSDENFFADFFLTGIVSNKMVLYPFVSVQRDFGYSDVTSVHNNNSTIVTQMFDRSRRCMERIKKAQERFR